MVKSYMEVGVSWRGYNLEPLFELEVDRKVGRATPGRDFDKARRQAL